MVGKIGKLIAKHILVKNMVNLPILKLVKLESNFQ